MKEQKMSLIGIFENEKTNTTFRIIRDIFINCGFSLIYENKDENIIFLNSNTNEHIGIINIFPENFAHLSSLGLKFKIIVYTNSRKNNLLREDIKKFFVSFKNIIVLNVDQDSNIELLKGNDKALVITYGLSNKSTVTASSLSISDLIKFNFCLQREFRALNEEVVEPLEFPVKMNLLGKEYIYSALAAISVALCYGLDVGAISKALLKVKESHRKMEKIYEGDFIAIDNFCLDSVDYHTTFSTIQHMTYKNIVLLKGVELEEGIYTIKKNLKIILNWVPILGIKKIIFFINKRDKLIEDNIKYLFIEKKISCDIFYELETCIEQGLKFIEKDDIFLFLGSDILKNCKEILIDKLNTEK